MMVQTKENKIFLKKLIRGLAHAGPPIFLFLVLGFTVSNLFLLRIDHENIVTNKKASYAAPPKGLEHFIFGFKESAADLFWIRALQDFDFCNNEIAKRICVSKSWLFQVLDVITDLDPRYRAAYSAGGLALSVILSDSKGASIIFDKGIVAFPHDWVLAYKAAYHALYEEKNTRKAALLMRLAAENGAPSWVYSIAGRLYSETGDSKVLADIISEMDSLNIEPVVRERLRQKLEELSKTQPAQ